MIGANAACEIAQGPDRCLRRLCEAQCAQLVQFISSIILHYLGLVLMAVLSP
jgi:hypothetical protein